MGAGLLMPDVASAMLPPTLPPTLPTQPFARLQWPPLSLPLWTTVRRHQPTMSELYAASAERLHVTWLHQTTRSSAFSMRAQNLLLYLLAPSRTASKAKTRRVLQWRALLLHVVWMRGGAMVRVDGCIFTGRAITTALAHT